MFLKLATLAAVIDLEQLKKLFWKALSFIFNPQTFKPLVR
jgi:hypothetical protein